MSNDNKPKFPWWSRFSLMVLMSAYVSIMVSLWYEANHGLNWQILSGAMVILVGAWIPVRALMIEAIKSCEHGRLISSIINCTCVAVWLIVAWPGILFYLGWETFFWGPDHPANFWEPALTIGVLAGLSLQPLLVSVWRPLREFVAEYYARLALRFLSRGLEELVNRP